MTSATMHEAGPLRQTSRDTGVDELRAMCHDLRQPLAAILLLAGTRGGDPAERLDAIAEQAQWLADVVDDVLSGSHVDQAGPVDLGRLTAAAAERSRPTAACAISVSADDDCLVHAQPVALGRAIGCVMDNAVRAAGDGGHVRIDVYRRRGQINVTVRDDGPGLGRVPAQTSMGLTITSALVAACGGRFELASAREGGAVARITLPALSRPAVAS